MMKALAFGEILWDIIEGKHYIGGAPFNFAAHVVRNGGQATILSSVGNDELGRRAIDEVNRLGVDSSMVAVHESRPTGTVDVFLREGQPDYTIHQQVAFDYISDSALPAILHQEFDVFYFGSLAQRNEVSSRSLDKILNSTHFRQVFYDINIRKAFYSREIVARSLERSTIFKINDQEAQIISRLFFDQDLSLESFAQKIINRFEVPLVIITAAEKGCYVASEGEFIHVSAVPVMVADAVGAGDAFSAAFVSNLLRTRDIRQAAEVANRVGAFVASQRGAIPDYPESLLE